MTQRVLAGKIGLVFGVANKRSIAWAIAKAWAKITIIFLDDREAAHNA